MNQYLMPANSKKSRLILGFFTGRDLYVCAIGIIFTIIFLLVLKNPSFWELILAITPLLIAAALVFPLPNYHNVMQFLINVFSFFLGKRRYRWKGWCIKNEE